MLCHDVCGSYAAEDTSRKRVLADGKVIVRVKVFRSALQAHCDTSKISPGPTK